MLDSTGNTTVIWSILLMMTTVELQSRSITGRKATDLLKLNSNVAVNVAKPMQYI